MQCRNEVSKQSEKKAWLLSGLAAGGFPTQAVLYEDRGVVDVRCQVCFDEPGAQMRRLFICPAHCGLRRHLDLHELQERAAEPGADLLFFAGVDLQCLQR
eukprot:4050877-Pyramimonas_sp.AAC.1